MSSSEDLLQISVSSQGSHQVRAAASASLLEALGEYRMLKVTAPEPIIDVGSKAAGASWEQVIISLGAAGALLPTAVRALRDWLIRQPPTTTIKIKKGDAEFEYSSANPMSESLEQTIRAIALGGKADSRGHA